ncbi:hypothetical protein CANARDRAFT_29290 [[Candida] arabinofermentans NRRL YB-2248]|uniref:Prefoldin subunit 5 n=1 Tax=[Candida] arabinofermentans NRRL YB-2248 TaxID=983967 RepID=A0A1E4SXA8_9ASCO|nr:hypothetical protein CANARDRAFT_29290 [[Candida] arabinofermentans NRRL YB-2248]
MSQKVDLTKLQPEQIMQFKNQLNQELEHLQTSFQALKTAQMKYKECNENVKQVSQNNDQETLIPLTSSLYVPGKVKNSDLFLIDVGTGYYVEKSTEEASKFFNGRLSKLDEDGGKLATMINEKLEILDRVDNILRSKLMEQQKLQGQQAQAQAQAQSQAQQQS